MACPAEDREYLEQRGAARLTLLLRAAKLTCPQGEFPCILRDVSDTGASVQLFHALPPDADLTLEMVNGDRFPLKRVWERNRNAGFSFIEPGKLDVILAGASPYSRRPLRLQIAIPCDVAAKGRLVSAYLGNLSQQGAMFRSHERFAKLQRLTLVLGHLVSIEAIVRWRRDDRHGVCFTHPLGMAELAAMSFALQRENLRRGDPRINFGGD